MRICRNSNGRGRDRRRDEEISSANGSEIEIVDQEEAGSATAAASATAAEVEDSDINGEAVRNEMECERKFQRLRTWVAGIGFSMGVVGIWGDRV
jgi:autophagy-related protein 33